MKERYQNYQIKFTDHSVFEVVGTDAKDYLQRQFTNDITQLDNENFHVTCRLTRVGQLHYFLYLLRKTDSFFYILIDNSLRDIALSDLNKFIITEDVEIVETSLQAKFLSGPSLPIFESSYSGNWCNEAGEITFEDTNIEDLDATKREVLETLSAWPISNVSVRDKVLINNTYLNEIAVSYNKGCFLGQETAGKIQSGRGGAKFPVLIISNIEISQGEILEKKSKAGEVLHCCSYDGKFFILAEMKREYRVFGKSYEFTCNGNSFFGEIQEIGYFKDRCPKGKSSELLNLAVKKFHSTSKESALPLLELSIAYNPRNADAYELKGAILGQLERYEEALTVMDDLLNIDENSVMAHTNKSLFYMKIGEIEKAEEEKSLATVAGFQALGQEAAAKKAKAEEMAKKEADIKRREVMFLKVLEMDAEDEIANYGISDISFMREDYEKSYRHLQVVLKNNEKYSTAYSLLGKTCEKLGKISEAIDIYTKGIDIATKSGDMMPANEMQSRLNYLKSN